MMLNFLSPFESTQSLFVCFVLSPIAFIPIVTFWYLIDKGYSLREFLTGKKDEVK